MSNDVNDNASVFRNPIALLLFPTIFANEKGVKFTFGKFSKVVEPGWRFRVPIIQNMAAVNMSENVMNITTQSVVSNDNVTFYTDAAIHWQVVDAKACFLNVSDLETSLLQITKAEIRNVIGEYEFNDILKAKHQVMHQVLERICFVERQWGVKLYNVQFTDISFDENMRRAMAVKAEADRNAEAKIIQAEADVKSARMYKEAADIYTENPITLRLREYQLWSSVSKNPSNSVFVISSDVGSNVAIPTSVPQNNNNDLQDLLQELKDLHKTEYQKLQHDVNYV